MARDPRKVTIRGVDYWRSAKEMARKETLGELDRKRRIIGAETDQGFMLSNVSEILRSIPEADVAPSKPPRSTICAHTNLTTWLLPNAAEDLAQVMGNSHD